MATVFFGHPTKRLAHPPGWQFYKFYGIADHIHSQKKSPVLYTRPDMFLKNYLHIVSPAGVSVIIEVIIIAVVAGHLIQYFNAAKILEIQFTKHFLK